MSDYPDIPPAHEPWEGYQAADQGTARTALQRLDADLWTKGFENNEPFVWRALRHICNQLMDGRSLKAILIEDRETPDGTARPMPDRATILAWLERAEQLRGSVPAENPYITFCAMEKVARKGQVAAMIDDCLVIADDKEDDFKEVFDSNGNVKRVFDREHVQRSTLKIKTRLHLAKIARATRFAFEDEPEHIPADQAGKISDVEDIVRAAEARTQRLPAATLEHDNRVKERVK